MHVFMNRMPNEEEPAELCVFLKMFMRQKFRKAKTFQEK